MGFFIAFYYFMKKINIFLQQNWFKAIIALIILLIGFSIFYYFVIFIPQKEQVRNEALQKEQLLQQQRIIEEKQAAQEKALAEEWAKQEEARIATENKFWKDTKTSIQESRDAANTIWQSAKTEIIDQRDWLNMAYSMKTNLYYSSLIPVIDATEHYIGTLQSLIDSIDKLNSVRYSMLKAAEQQDGETYNSFIDKHNSVVDTFSYWSNLESKEAEELNALKTETIKNF